MLERRQHVEREEVRLNVEVLVELAQALGEVRPEVELKRVLHADGAHLLLDLRRHERREEGAAQDVVEDEAAQVLAG